MLLLKGLCQDGDLWDSPIVRLLDRCNIPIRAVYL